MHLPTTQNVVVAAAVHPFPVSGYVAPVKGDGRENTAAALIVELGHSENEPAKKCWTGSFSVGLWLLQYFNKLVLFAH